MKAIRQPRLPAAARNLLEEALASHGQRLTRHRELIFGMLLSQRDHPTADEVFLRSRSHCDSLSLATVYNTLETLVQCGLVRAVNYEREPTRFCPNLSEHAHFQDKRTGRVYDIDLPETVIEQLKAVLPEGFQAESLELYFHGRTSPKTSPAESNHAH
ncbi:MAG: transcriptional repressor [Opitutales bacterium]|nr:transcriptional repressor [Opitutales bacterium]